MKKTEASDPSLHGSEIDHRKSESRKTKIEQTMRTGRNMNTASDDENLLEELLKDPVTARLLLAWRRSIRELQQAEEAACAAG